MAFTLLKNNFTGGEWSPRLEGRSDLEGYGSACRQMQNMRPMVHGGATKRGGLQFVAKTQGGGQAVRLIEFQFSVSTRYMIEAGDGYFRIYRGWDATVAVGSLPTPYAAGELRELQFKQLNDIMYLVHPQHAPRRLSRLADTNWKLEEVKWDYPPLRDENTEEHIQLKYEKGVLSAQGAAVFNSGHVGSYFELRHLKQADGVELVMTEPLGPHWAVSPTLAVRGEWELTTSEFWWGQVFLERSRDNGATWEVLRRWQGRGDRNISASGKIDEEDAEQLMRINYQNHGDPYHPPAMNSVNGDMPAGWKHGVVRLETKDEYVRGLVRVTGYSSPTAVSAQVVGKHRPASDKWTDRWSEGAWSAHRGYPRAVGFFEQRMLYAGSRSQPQRVWGSRGSDFENFRYGEEDDAAVAFDIAATEGNPILWLEGWQRILIGTSGGEFVMSGAAGGEAPLTPSSVMVRRVSAYGAQPLAPLAANEALIFVQRQGKKLREWVLSLQREGEGARDLCVQAEHLFSTQGMRDIAFVRWPDPTVVVALGDSLGVLTYDKESGIQAWTRYTTEDGIFESVRGLYGDPIDEVWCVVRRKVNGAWQRFIEKFAPEGRTKQDARYLDCHKSGTLPMNWNGGVAVGAHLNGALVQLMVGGTVVQNVADGGLFKVINGGIHVPDKVRDQMKAVWAVVEAQEVGASLPRRAWVAGLPYRSVIETMRLEVDGDSGSTAGKVRRVHSLLMRFQNTGPGVSYGRSGGGRLEEVNFRDAVDAMDGTPPLFSDEKRVQFPLGHDRAARVLVVQDQPLPFTLLGLAVTAEITQQ